MQSLHRLALLGLALGSAACAQLGRGVTYQTFRASFDPCPAAQSAGARIVKDGPLRFLEARRPQAIAQVLYFHGVGKGACDRLSLIKPLQDMGCDVLLGEYPGFDGEGVAREKDMLENALALRDRIVSERPDLPLIVFGESLGTAVATYLAAQRPCDALVLQSPFTSVTEVGQYSYAMIPVKLFMDDSFPSKDWAPRVQAPVLAFCGSIDWVVPPQFSHRQMKNFKVPTELVEFKGAGHETMIEREGPRYFQAFKKLVNQVALCE